MTFELHPTETRHTHECVTTLRYADGPAGREVFIHCQPARLGGRSAAEQAEAAYLAILDALTRADANATHIVSENVFLAAVDADRDAVRAARARVLPNTRTTTLEIEQPPLSMACRLEIAAQAVVPANGGSVGAVSLPGGSSGGAAGMLVSTGDEQRLYANGLCGDGDSAYDQSWNMFLEAERVLEAAGMGFADVARTWIHIADIDNDYDALNRARRAFFEARGITPIPASTGIGGATARSGRRLCLGIYAVRGNASPDRCVMTTPTLNEAPRYGADFSRGMRVEETNRAALLVSGTASLDESGRTAHVGDFDGQVERMLLNVATLLERAGAGFEDIVSGTTYLKHAGDAGRLKARFAEAGFEGFGNVLVQAHVCRAELLCETEVLALRPPKRNRAR